MSKTYNIQISDVDLDLLREQKRQLLLLQGRTELTNSLVLNSNEFEAVDGIINLIDHIQDSAVQQHGLDEEEVFTFSNK